MSFEFRPAKRENVSLLIGLAGGTGSGKTYSAMRLAKGLAGAKRFAVIDTENGRARHYADQFDFDVTDLVAPFRPDAYAQAIKAADEAGYGVIVVDSASHEHAGEGGLLDMHEEEFQRMGGRDAVKLTAWIKPKLEHKAMVNKLLQVRAHVILCFRAQQSIDIVKGPDGKMQIVPKKTLTGLDGWVPICEKNLPYELTLSFLLTADAPGLPKPIKLQEQHRAFFPLGVPIGEETGAALGGWAVGGSVVSPAAPLPVVGDQEPGLTEADPPPAPTFAEEIAALVGELNDLSAALGVDTSEAVLKNQLEHLPDAPAKHITWLRNQVKRLREKLDAAAGEESQFKIPEGAV